MRRADRLRKEKASAYIRVWHALIAHEAAWPASLEIIRETCARRGVDQQAAQQAHEWAIFEMKHDAAAAEAWHQGVTAALAWITAAPQRQAG